MTTAPLGASCSVELASIVNPIAVVAVLLISQMLIAFGIAGGVATAELALIHKATG